MPKDLHLSDFFCTFATSKVKRTTKSDNNGSGSKTKTGV